MKINGESIDIAKVIEENDYNNLLIKRRENNLLLSDYQVSVLNNNSFDYKKYGSLRELLFDIEDYLNENYDEELDIVSNQIAEMIYYMDTKK